MNLFIKGFKLFTLLLVGVSILIFIYNIYLSRQVIIAPIYSVDFSKYSYCLDDTDCVRVQAPRCDGCDCGAYINATYQDEYWRKVGSYCENYNGPVCGVGYCPKTKSKCLKGKCVGVGVL